MRTRTFVVAGVVVAFLIAGVGSYYASRHPDGLMHVAEQAGFAQTAKDSATSRSPLSGYQVKGVHDGAVSRGLAGVLGALAVLVLAGGLTYAVRRRSPADERPADEGSADEGSADERPLPLGRRRD